MRVSMRSRIAPLSFTVVTLLVSLAFTPAGFAEEPGLLYGTAAGGTELVAFNLQAEDGQGHRRHLDSPARSHWRSAGRVEGPTRSPTWAVQA